MGNMIMRVLRWLGVAALGACVSCGGRVVVDGAGASTGSATPPTPSCGTYEVGFTGAIDGVVLQDEVTEGLVFETEEVAGGLTEGDGVFIFPAQNDGAPGVGTVRIPAPAASDPSPSPTSPGQWICELLAPNVSQDIGVGAFLGEPVTLTGLRRLGACPGAPIGGAIVCQGGTCALGELGGTMTNGAEIMGTGGVVDGSSPNVAAFDAGGLFVNISAQSGGVVRLPDDHPDAGALVCVGSVVVAANGVVTLSELSRLGTCAEAAAIGGELTVCEGPI
jgi:hypothetical protein